MVTASCESTQTWGCEKNSCPVVTVLLVASKFKGLVWIMMVVASYHGRRYRSKKASSVFQENVTSQSTNKNLNKFNDPNDFVITGIIT